MPLHVILPATRYDDSVSPPWIEIWVYYKLFDTTDIPQVGDPYVFKLRGTEYHTTVVKSDIDPEHHEPHITLDSIVLHDLIVPTEKIHQFLQEDGWDLCMMQEGAPDQLNNGTNWKEFT